VQFITDKNVIKQHRTLCACTHTGPRHLKIIGKKEKRGEEPIQVVLHIFMEMSHGNSLYNYLKQTKMSFYFSSTKLENRRVEQVLPVGGVVPVGGGRMWEKCVGG
jgi:hypothetical protein